MYPGVLFGLFFWLQNLLLCHVELVNSSYSFFTIWHFWHIGFYRIPHKLMLTGVKGVHLIIPIKPNLLSSYFVGSLFLNGVFSRLFS